jgi:hypothetical protein
MATKKKRTTTRRRAAGAARGARNVVLQVLAGVGAGAVHNLGGQKVNFIANNWWAGPAALAALGVLMTRSRRLGAVGNAALGAAGYAGYIGYKMAGSQSNGNGNGSSADTGLLHRPGRNRYDVGLLFQRHHVPELDAKPVMPPAAEVATDEYENDISPAIETIGL